MVNKKSPQGLGGLRMIRNNYEDTIFAITNKLNENLECMLEHSRGGHSMSLDKDIVELAHITAKFNELLMKVIDRNAMVKEFISEGDNH